MIISLFTLLSFSVLLVVKFFKNVDCEIPGPKAFPIIGNSFEFLKDNPLAVIKNLKNRFNKIFRLWLGSDLCIVMSDPADVELILKNSKHISKAKSYDFLKRWLGNGLITADGETWLIHRKFLTPTFRFQLLENSLKTIHWKSQKFVQQLESYVNRNQFDIHVCVDEFSLDLISEVVMNLRSNPSVDNHDSYFQAVKNILKITIDRAFDVWVQYEFMFRLTSRYKKFNNSWVIVKNVTRKIIELRRKNISETSSSVEEALKTNSTSSFMNGPTADIIPTSFLDAVLKNSSFNDREIFDEIQTFIFAGHDTTATGISFCIHQLSNHPEVQDKVYEEVMSVISYPDTPTIEDLNKLKYMDSVIKETLRLFPPVPMIGRTISEGIVTPSGYKIPAGSQINIFIYGLHRDPTVFSEPEKFIPERFEDNTKRNPFSFIPFSSGPRNCIGQKFAMLEIKITLVNLLKKYKLLPATRTKSMKLSVGVTLRCKNGLPIRIENRE